MLCAESMEARPALMSLIIAFLTLCHWPSPLFSFTTVWAPEDKVLHFTPLCILSAVLEPGTVGTQMVSR